MYCQSIQGRPTFQKKRSSVMSISKNNEEQAARFIDVEDNDGF